MSSGTSTAQPSTPEEGQCGCTNQELTGDRLTAQTSASAVLESEEDAADQAALCRIREAVAAKSLRATSAHAAPDLRRFCSHVVPYFAPLGGARRDCAVVTCATMAMATMTTTTRETNRAATTTTTDNDGSHQSWFLGGLLPGDVLDVALAILCALPRGAFKLGKVAPMVFTECGYGSGRRHFPLLVNVADPCVRFLLKHGVNEFYCNLDADDRATSAGSEKEGGKENLRDKLCREIEGIITSASVESKAAVKFFSLDNEDCLPDEVEAVPYFIELDEHTPRLHYGSFSYCGYPVDESDPEYDRDCRPHWYSHCVWSRRWKQTGAEGDEEVLFGGKTEEELRLMLEEVQCAKAAQNDGWKTRVEEEERNIREKTEKEEALQEGSTLVPTYVLVQVTYDREGHAYGPPFNKGIPPNQLLFIDEQDRRYQFLQKWTPVTKYTRFRPFYISDDPRDDDIEHVLERCGDWDGSEDVFVEEFWERRKRDGRVKQSWGDTDETTRRIAAREFSCEERKGRRESSGEDGALGMRTVATGALSEDV